MVDGWIPYSQPCLCLPALDLKDKNIYTVPEVAITDVFVYGSSTYLVA